MTATSSDNATSLLQELTQTRHKLDQLEQQLQDSSHKATQSEQQHQAVIMRLTRDLEQEQMARSYSPALPLPICMPCQSLAAWGIPMPYRFGKQNIKTGSPLVTSLLFTSSLMLDMYRFDTGVGKR